MSGEKRPSSTPIPGEEPTYDARPEVEKRPSINHVYAWYSESNGSPFVSVVWPFGCSREEALTKRPQPYGDVVIKAALIKIPLDREWLS